MLSIIVPIYNSSLYLESCINSLLEQSYKDIEIILINDGSTDNSLNICNKFKEKDKRIIVFSQKNKGPGAAKNLGLKKAKGDFITFVDSDDSVEKFTYEKNISYFENNPLIDIVQFPYIDKYNSPNQTTFSPVKQTIHGKENLFNHWLTLHNISWIFCNKIFSADFIKGLRFPENMYFEDNYLIIETLNKNPIIQISPHGKYYYYKRENSITTSFQGEKKELDTIKVNLFILDSISSLDLKKAKSRTISKLLNNIISQSINYNKIDKKKNFTQHIKEISNFDILKSKISNLEKIKLLIVKFFGISFFIKIYHYKQNFITFDFVKPIQPE